jgi:hypothetical protein
MIEQRDLFLKKKELQKERGLEVKLKQFSDRREEWESKYFKQ